MITAALIITVVALVLGLSFKKLRVRKRREGEPVIVPGHPLFGNAQEFSENGVNFIHRCKKQFGKIFTMRLLNEYLTIISDPHSVQAMGREKNFDFDPIQRQVNYNVFKFKLVDAKNMLKETAKTVKGEHLEQGMKNFNKNLMESIDTLSSPSSSSLNNEWTTRYMRDVTSQTLFYSIFTTIFGKDPTNSFKPIETYKTFDTFHKYFNYLWLGIPIKLFSEAQKALKILAAQPSSDELLQREDLSEYIRFSINFMKEHNQTENDIVGHSLVYLHVNYNSFRLAYWCLYNLMAHPEAHAALQEEINDYVESRLCEEDNSAALTTTEVEKMPYLDSLVKETIRLTSGTFMIRYVNENTNFTLDDGQTYTCRKGDRVAFYPPAVHKDPEIFERPLEFKHDRFVDTDYYYQGKELKNPIIGFGTLCPGKRYALLEVKWFILAMTHMFDYQLPEGQTTECDTQYHGHEILPPVRDVTIRYRRKNTSVPTLSLV